MAEEEPRMSEPQARRLIYNIFYEYINAGGEKPTIEEFFDTNIAESLDVSGQLEGWSEFLTDAIAVDIHRSFKRQGYWIQNFSSSWLRDNGSKKWEALLTHMKDGNLVDIE